MIAQGKAGHPIYCVYMAGGDRSYGAPLGLVDEKLRWRDSALGAISFPLDAVIGIAPGATPPPGLEDVRTDDIVRLANGDATHGVINQLSETGVALQTPGGVANLAWDSVSAVLLSTAPGGSAKPPRLLRVALAWGSIVSATALDFTDSGATLTLADRSVYVIGPVDILSIEQVNGPVSWLSGRRPSQNIYRPFLSESFPTRFDQTVDSGQPIAERFPGFHHGIGCHSYAKLVYPLDAQYVAFRTQFAIDSESPLADVTVRVLLDDKVVLERKGVKAGTIYPVLTVPLGPARTLGLEVDYGENYATEDRFVWLDPALVAALPATAPATREASSPASTTSPVAASPAAASEPGAASEPATEPTTRP